MRMPGIEASCIRPLPFGAAMHLTPYLRPFTALPGEPRQEGW
jgi:hypothetical protein